MRRLTRYCNERVLREGGFRNNGGHGHVEALFGELRLETKQYPSEKFVVTFHHLRMLPGGLGFDLDLSAIQPLRNPLGGEARLAIRDQDARN